jgi:SPP1 family predicted phage head-tail adaptor
MALTNRELQEARDAVLDLLTDTCDLLTKTSVSDGMGGQVDTWGTVGFSVACRMDAVSGSESFVGAGLQAFSGYMLTLPYDTAIDTSYRVEHGGNTYDVLAVNGDQSNLIVVRAQLQRV